MINLIKRLGSAWSFAAALFFIIGGMAIASSPAHAGIFVCNDAGTQISVAIGWKEGEARASHSRHGASSATQGRGRSCAACPPAPAAPWSC